MGQNVDKSFKQNIYVKYELRIGDHFSLCVSLSMSLSLFVCLPVYFFLLLCISVSQQSSAGQTAQGSREKHITQLGLTSEASDHLHLTK